jgi:MinD-like ATPase involved in chromosome partitioning or flagellar assembly
MVLSISAPAAPDTPALPPTMVADHSLPVESGSERSGFPTAVGKRSGTETVPVITVRARPVPHEFGPADVAERVWLRAAALEPAALVAVSSADGGVGRSTLTAALGGLLALAVPEPVVAVDMHPVPWGGLGERVGRSSAGTMWDAVRDLHTLTSRREVERWTQHSPSGLLTLVGETEGQGRRPPRHDEAAAVVEAVRRLYPLTICDVMPALITGVWRTLAAAYAPVLVARATTDSLHHTMRLLTHLRAAGNGAVVDRAVLAVVAASPTTERTVRAVLQQAATVVPDVVSIPYDPQLARPEPVDARRLKKQTRTALVQLADAVIGRCADPRVALPIAARKERT